MFNLIQHGGFIIIPIWICGIMSLGLFFRSLVSFTQSSDKTRRFFKWYFYSNESR